MSKDDIESKLKEIKELQQMRDEIDQNITELEEQIKADMQQQNIDEIKTNLFTVRWKAITSNRFDSKSFKAENEKLYMLYLKPSVTRRFSIA